MKVASPQLVSTILWAAPVIQTVATIGLLVGASSFRRGLGAMNMHAGTLAAFGAATLFLHIGYFLAPHWWKSGRHLLGAATMLPIALLVLGAMLVVLTQTDIGRALMRAEIPIRVATVAVGSALVLAYLGPLVLMLAATA